ncbi:hypothetical protein ZIOFF_039746 [Zingiber officinale]|uniref:Aspergillus nuclease S1 n=1 Tax=Zingiber officinale TaxID=94328 RepID=A0A8J5L0E4_ZINOF|nr:hypothetical protein ZIOFF_039746 [Zingiber officinale]
MKSTNSKCPLLLPPASSRRLRYSGLALFAFLCIKPLLSSSCSTLFFFASTKAPRGTNPGRRTLILLLSRFFPDSARLLEERDVIMGKRAEELDINNLLDEIPHLRHRGVLDRPNSAGFHIADELPTSVLHGDGGGCIWSEGVPSSLAERSLPLEETLLLQNLGAAWSQPLDQRNGLLLQFSHAGLFLPALSIPSLHLWMGNDEDGVKGRCVSGAITNYTNQLLTYGSSADESQYNLTEALLFLSHLMGDIHQPLHVGFTSDRGGNTIPVRWFRRKSELHKVWDKDIIETIGDRFYDNVVEEFLDALKQNITGEWSDQVVKWEKCSNNKVACPDVWDRKPNINLTSGDNSVLYDHDLQSYALFDGDGHQVPQDLVEKVGKVFETILEEANKLRYETNEDMSIAQAIKLVEFEGLGELRSKDEEDEGLGELRSKDEEDEGI